jgi:O-antigen/teichoic acid export membrane protein
LRFWASLAGPAGRQLFRPAIAWTLADQILVSGSNFATSVIVARELGPAGFGVFALSWIAVLFGQSILTAAFAQPIMSLGPKQAAARAERYYGASFTIQIAGAVAIGVLLALALLAMRLLGGDPQIENLLIPVSASLLASQVQDYLRRYAFTKGEAPRVLAADAGKYVAQLGLLLVLLAQPALSSVTTALWITAAAAAVGCVPFAPTMPRLVLEVADLRDALRRNIAFSRWLVGAALLQWLTGNFFLIVSGALLGPAVTGTLRAGQTLLGTLHVFFQAADNIVPPRAAQLHHERGNEAVFALVNRLLLVGGFGTALVAVVIAGPGDLWMRLLFGHAFAGTGLVVAAYGVAYIFIACTMPLRYGFLATEKTSAIFRSYVIASAFNLIVAWPLVHVLGEYGALIGIVAVQAVLMFSMLFSYLRLERR